MFTVTVFEILQRGTGSKMVNNWWLITDITFISSFYRGYVRRSRNNIFENEKIFQIIGIVLVPEESVKSFTIIFQGFCLNFKLTLTSFKVFGTFRATLGGHLMMPASANMFQISQLTIRTKLI